MTRLNKQDIRDIRFHKTKAKLLAKLGNEEELNNCYNNILEISYKDEDIEKHDRIRESFFEINNHHHYTGESDIYSQFSKKIESLETDAEKLIDFYTKIIKDAHNTHLELHNLDRKFKRRGREGYYKTLSEICENEIDVIRSMSPSIRYDKASKLEEIGEHEQALDCYNNIIRLFHGDKIAVENRARLEEKLGREDLDKFLEGCKPTQMTNLGTQSMLLFGGSIVGAIAGGVTSYLLSQDIASVANDNGFLWDQENVSKGLIYGGALIGGFLSSIGLSKKYKE
ncbi:hypothetical protein HON86_03570 [Candidatus Woesearchaeota archaeon]|jgi:tetratricopeptide (TPR) repeat protein|nr:hypothetical protein [Candidatus Woesearchaeota archaeon]MBT4835662.1 hypothetical protein [Candidatus Woesearchaeota archaeon]MBT6734986.1 hypothetical protein [Candidatus Woesearchaeota archaeon]MBT7170006.1 hypothetical protein [Candidatus Woesearchaeota archaeon]MBT7474737.1 hypothetical protein [Candidatus Woesearchaeota archaeon]